MQDQKSYAEFVLGTYRALLVDCARQYPELAKEFRRDYSRLSSAVDSHGIHFVMATMPAFRKHLDGCLRDGRLIPSNLPNFGVDKKGGTIPRLFRGLVLRVFDRSGALRHVPDTISIFLLRQLCAAFGDFEMKSNRRDTCESVRQFFKDDVGVHDGSLNWRCHHLFSSEDASRLSFEDRVGPSAENRSFFDLTPSATHDSCLMKKVQQCADLISSVLGVFDPHEWRPKHGPGAVADQRFGVDKYDFKTWPDRLDSVFPWETFAFANYSEVPLITCGSESFAALQREMPSKLIAVPKTLTKPRLIASEPTSHQWCQQIIKDYFYTRVRRTWISSFITFDDQGPNGRIALEASRTGSHATIDLSSASDLVACWHVERLFRRLPSLLDALQSSRTVWIQQTICRNSPRYHYLRKYSTMGNATIFPVQSLFFLAVALGVLTHVRRLPVTYKTMKSLGREEVRVFGDDIVVPDDCSGVLVSTLQALGLRVNATKTFLTGRFRESCGVDAYGGDDVTPVSILCVPSRNRPGSIVSSVDVNHNLADAGLLETASFIRKTAEPLVRFQVRTVTHRSGLFGWSDWTEGDSRPVKVRWNPHLQIREVRAMKLRVSEHRRAPDTSAGLLRYFTEAPRVTESAKSTLSYLTRRPKVGLTIGWVPAGNHHVA